MTAGWQVYLQEELEGGCGELQPRQPDLNTREGRGADYLECHHTKCAEQPGDQTQPAGIHERRVLLCVIMY